MYEPFGIIVCWKKSSQYNFTKKGLTKVNVANLVAICVKWYLAIGSTEDLKKER